MTIDDAYLVAKKEFPEYKLNRGQIVGQSFIFWHYYKPQKRSDLLLGSGLVSVNQRGNAKEVSFEDYLSGKYSSESKVYVFE